MKREDLKALGLSDEVIEQVMGLHGKGVESLKSGMTALQAEADGLKGQLAEAGKAIEGFKALDVEGVKKAADDWKAKAEAAQTDAQAQVAALKFDYALDAALKDSKAKNSKAVNALLSRDALKFNEADGSIVGLKEQLEKIKADNDFLFEDAQPTPRIVSGGNNQTVITDSTVSAARTAAGLTPQK